MIKITAIPLVWGGFKVLLERFGADGQLISISELAGEYPTAAMALAVAAGEA